jgi:hypothetical protein
MPVLTINLALDALGGGVTAPANPKVTARRITEVVRAVDGVTYIVSPIDIPLELTAGRGSFTLAPGYYWVDRKGGPSRLVLLDHDARLDQLASLSPETLESDGAQQAGPGGIVASATNPGLTTPGIWLQTGLGEDGTDFTLWIEDGIA